MFFNPAPTAESCVGKATLHLPGLFPATLQIAFMWAGVLHWVGVSSTVDRASAISRVLSELLCSRGEWHTCER